MKRKILVVLGLVAFLGVGLGGFATADTEGTVNVSVTAQVVSITVGDSEVVYGSLPLGGTNNTFDGSDPAVGDGQTITNNSPVSVDITLKSSDADGVTTDWELATVTTCSSMGTDFFGHQYAIDATGPAVWTDFPATGSFENTFTGNVVELAASGTATLDMKLCMPSSTTDSGGHDIMVTALATEA